MASTYPSKGNFRFNLLCKYEFSQHFLEIFISESSTIFISQVKYGHDEAVVGERERQSDNLKVWIGLNL